MAELIIHTDKIKENILKLSDYFKSHGIHWSLITKVFSGDKEFLSHILTPELLQGIHSVGDSRLTSIRNLKALEPSINTIYIKPPAIVYADEIVRWADISLNTSLETIIALNDAARKLGKTHQIIIMIELGELREGVTRDKILSFYEKVFRLSNIDVIGIGSNLACMYGVVPTYDKLLQLTLYKELISAKFDKKLQLISGGSSVTLPLIEKGLVPADLNHFRVGEAAFFGISPYHGGKFLDLNTDTFEFYANIIELQSKKIFPQGVNSSASIGHTAEKENPDFSATSVKAILDIGLLDVDKDDITATGDSLEFVGVTSDMLVVDLGENKKDDGNIKYKSGDSIHFHPNYMGVARLLNSKFIDKKFI